MKNSWIKNVLLITIVLVTLSACSSNDNNNNNNNNNNDNVVLIWWNLFESQENVQPLIDAYEAAHTNVTIQYSQKGLIDGVADYKNELDAVISDADPVNTPDIFTIHNTWTGRYKKFISPAPASVITTNDLTDFYQVYRDDFVSGQNIYGLPLSMDALAVIYNKDQLINAGYSIPSDEWSEFQLQASNLASKNQAGNITTGGFSARIVSNTEFYFELINLLFLQNGVDMLDNEGNAIFASQSEASGALNFYNSFTQGTNKTWDADFKKDIAAFLEKDLAMYAAPSWRLINVLQYNTTYNLNIDVGVAPLPQLGGSEPIYYATYWGQTVSKDSSDTQVAWDFLKFITQAEQQRLFSNTVKQNGRPIGTLFVRQSMASELANDPYLNPYIVSLKNAKSWQMGDGYRVKALFDNAFENNLTLEQIQSGVNSILDQP